jgi:exopolysaccharide transport family protein
MTSRYTAAAQILLDHRKPDVVQNEVAPRLKLDTAGIESEVTLIRSFKIARRVVDKLHLDRDPEFTTPSRGLISKAIGAIAGLISKPDARPLRGALGMSSEYLAAVQALRRNVSARRVGVTFVVEVFATSKNPVSAARIANAVADAYLVEQLNSRYDAVKRASGWLQQRLAGLRNQVLVSERAVADYRRRYGIVDTRTGAIDKQQLSEISAQLILLRAEVAEKQAKYQQAQRILRRHGNVATVAEVLQSQVVANLRTQEAEVARREAELSTRYGRLHPQVVNVRAELADIQRAIRSEVRRIIANLKNQYEVAQKRQQSIEQSLDTLTGVATKNDTARIRLRELEREAETNRVLYQSFLSRFKETREQTTLGTANSRVITPAIMPNKASYPRRGLTLGLALFFGLGLGVMGALLLEHIENGFLTAEHVEATLNVPVLAVAPALQRAEYDPTNGGTNIATYVAKKPLSRFSEAMRSIRVAVSLSDVDNPPKLLLVTSSVPGEGKSTIASSLAISASASGQRVLLIDGDLRHPSTSKEFGLSGATGLVDMLAGTAQSKDVLRAFGNGLLAVLPAGSGTKNSPDLLGSQKMLQWLRASVDAYDLVVIDSPPVTAVSDGLLVAAHVDKVVFVVEWENTPREVVRRAMSVLGDNRDRLAGIVLNKAETKRMRFHSTYYGYYNIYNKRYGKYYSD